MLNRTTFSSTVYHSQIQDDALDLGPQAQLVQEGLELFPGEILQLDPICLRETDQMALKHLMVCLYIAGDNR